MLISITPMKGNRQDRCKADLAKRPAGRKPPGFGFDARKLDASIGWPSLKCGKAAKAFAVIGNRLVAARTVGRSIEVFEGEIEERRVLYDGSLAPSIRTQPPAPGAALPDDFPLQLFR
jgi:hypothetical protein